MEQPQALPWQHSNVTNVVLTIYTCISALVLIGLGIFKHKPLLRYFGFVLIGLTLIMLGLLITNMSNTVHRIIAFLLVGILFTVASFGYQRLSKKNSK